jgi:hypothetical protein
MNEEARHKVERRQRTPALAFLIGAAVVGAIALLAYLFWPDRAETPATPQEAVLTDDLDLPAPDGAAITRQVDEALAQSPAAGTAPAGEPGPDARANPSAAPVAPPETGPRAPNDPPPPLPND